MPLQYPVSPGTIVICDYSTGFRAPEMVKRRPAVIISPRLPHRDGLCTVVPLSESAPNHPVLYQCRVELTQDIPEFEGLVKWAKADMLATVGFGRIDLPRTARDKASGRRRYLQLKLTPEQLSQVRACVLHALGMGNLTGGAEQATS